MLPLKRLDDLGHGLLSRPAHPYLQGPGRPLRTRSATEDSPHPVIRIGADRDRLPPPAGPQILGGMPPSLFAGPALIGGQLEHRGPLPAHQRPPQHRLPVGDQSSSPGLDLLAPLREHGDQFVWHTVDLGRPIGIDRRPHNAEPGSQFGPQSGLVNQPGGLLHLEQFPSVERQPVPVRRGPHLVRHQDMRM
jgi:hypothetical protein